MRVLVVNAGSSSLKASVVGDDDETLADEELSLGDDATADAGVARPPVAELLQRLASEHAVGVVGHRVVHGGERFTDAVAVDDDVVAAVDGVRELAPLHVGVALETLAMARGALPDLPHVAAFDTAFHATLPETARRYPLPAAWERDHGVRRYGFHGLSVAWSARRAPALIGRSADDLGLVVAHLGSGCSVTAVDGGRSVDTTMGLTPLEGLMMGTRSGSIDPGILFHLLRTSSMTADELADALDHRSGLLAVDGTTASMQAIERRAAGGEGAARLAIEMFARRAAAGIAAMAVALRRLDALVFTGGIGSGSARIRSEICARLAVIGVPALDDPAPVPAADAVVARGERVSVLAIRAREDLVIARDARRVVGAEARG